jgi:hypothetical protein
MPVTFAAWYLMAVIATLPVTYLVNWLLMGLFPDVISGIQQAGYHVEAAAYYAAQSPTATLPRGMMAELVFEVNALSYGYGVPLYTALVLASPGEEGAKWFRWTVGIAILQITQAWGVSFDILKNLLFSSGPEVAEALSFAQWQMEAVALGYQFGYLILPAVAPLVIWIAFHSDYLETLAPGLATQK